MGVAWTYPITLVASFYLTWLIAWSILGHAPRPSLDDPKHISNWLAVPYYITVLLLIGFPAASLGGIAATVWFGVVRKVRYSVILIWLGTLMLLWVAAIIFLRWDPLQVGNWFMD